MAASEKLQQHSIFNTRHVIEEDMNDLHQISSSAFGTISPAGRFGMRQKLHASDGSLFLITETKDRKPVAYIYATMSPKSKKVFVFELAVLQNFRNLGIGQSLLTDLETEALSLEAKTIELHCDPDNVPAKRLYRRCGYFPVDVIKNYASDLRQLVRLAYVKNLIVA